MFKSYTLLVVLNPSLQDNDFVFLGLIGFLLYIVQRVRKSIPKNYPHYKNNTDNLYCL